MTCPSVSSFFSLLATRLYAAVLLVFLIIGIIILIFSAKVKGVDAIFYKKFPGRPGQRAGTPRFQQPQGSSHRLRLIRLLESLTYAPLVTLSLEFSYM